jgi:uncharacterized protein involved in exopolysaccharide biosynthesis
MEIPYPTHSTPVPKRHWISTIGRLLLMNSLLTLIAWIAIKTAKQTYSTQINLSIPSPNNNVSLNLPNVSSASISSGSPYVGARDPRASYQVLLQSQQVLNDAADRANLSLEAFGQPKIKLVDETTIMQISFNGKNPEEAQAKAIALYDALQMQLNQLRKEEIEKRELELQSSLGTSQQKLLKAQSKMNQFRVKSGLSSEEQIKDLAKNIEELRKNRSSLLAETQKNGSRLKGLTQNLGVSPRQATDSFILQSDSLFQQTLKNYSDITAGLVLLESNLAPTNPEVKMERTKQTEVRASLLQRGSQLLGRPITLEMIDRLTLSGSSTTATNSSRESLFRDLVTTQIEGNGTASQVQALDSQIQQLEQRLQRLVQQQSGLDTLKRDVQMAEAVFSSKLTQADVNRGNIYDSYPLVQKLSGPDLPQPVAFPNPIYVVLGTVTGSILISSAIIIHALRRSRCIPIHQSTLG